MRHYQLIEAAAFDPTTLVVIETAFESAWSEIAHHFGDTDADLARSRLAEALLIVAEQHPHRRTSGSENRQASASARPLRGTALRCHRGSRNEPPRGPSETGCDCEP